MQSNVEPRFWESLDLMEFAYEVERNADGHWRLAKAVWNTDHEGAV